MINSTLSWIWISSGLLLILLVLLHSPKGDGMGGLAASGSSMFSSASSAEATLNKCWELLDSDIARNFTNYEKRKSFSNN